MLNIYRAWINQPSFQQKLHKMHGQPCIAVDSGQDYIDVYFTEGSVISMRISRLAVSEGDRKNV